VKILGREPALWIGFVSSLIIVLGTFGLHLLSGQQAALIVVAINAVAGGVTAYAVRPVSPAAFTYAVGSLIALAGAYGLNLSIETVATLNAAVIPTLTLMTRGQVSPHKTSITSS
jgi:hypothetical protein